MLQAGFYENEIDAIISSQSTFETSSIEDRALRELNESVERVKEEYSYILELFFNSENITNFSNSLLEQGYSVNQITKIRALLQK